MVNVPKTASGRLYCRICSGLAGMTRNICNDCRVAEVRRQIQQAKDPEVPTVHDVQDAYSKSLVLLPNVTRPPGPPGVEAEVVAGVTQGANPPTDTSGLAHAQRFSAVLLTVPKDKSQAEVFYNLSRINFYHHVRGLLRTFNPHKRLTVRRRESTEATRTNVRAQTIHNQSLALAMRLIRIYLQMEIIPLALKMGSSHTQVWHIESCANVVSHKWVAKYAEVFGLKTQGIYSFAASLIDGDDLITDTTQMVLNFTRYALMQEANPSAHINDIKTISGAATHLPHPTGGNSQRVHPGTGNPFNKALGQALRYVRMRAGMEAPEFAAKAPISISHICNVEGDRKKVSAKWVSRWAEITNVNEDHIWVMADRLEAAAEAGQHIDDVWLDRIFMDIQTTPAGKFYA